MTLKQYIFNNLIAIDQLINALIKGHPDETMSSRCYRNAQKYWYARWGMKALDFVFRPWGPDHCKTAYESELTRKHNFPEVPKDGEDVDKTAA